MRPAPGRVFPLAAAAFSLLAAPSLSGQQFPFQLRARQDQNVSVVPNNATLNFAALSLGLPVTIDLTVTYIGRATVSIQSAPQLLGSTAFSFTTSIEAIPLTLQPGGSFNLTVTFRPVSSTRALGQLNVGYLEPATPPDLPVPGTISFNLVGSVPEFSVNYALQADANVIPVSDGGTLLFPDTVFNTSALATVIILNRGSGPGEVSAITLSGDPAFQLLGLPLLPTTLSSTGDIRFNIRYAPRSIGANTATLQIRFGDVTNTFKLEGTATGSILSYQLIRDGEATSITPNQLITVPDTPVGERASLTFEVRNTGNADSAVNVIAVAGTGFALTDAPFLPIILVPNELLSFTVTFAPLQPGRATARLRVANDTFDLVASGIGQRLEFSYKSGDSVIPVQPTGVIPFSPLAVGQTSSLEIQVRNTGTSSATISSIGVAEPAATPGVFFSLGAVPSLPATLAPDASLSFTLSFAPGVTGFVTAQLLIDNRAFTLSGFGNPPPPLPGYVFTGASGIQPPLQQLSIGLALVEPYALPLRGLLTLTVDSEAFSSDPAVQFITGARTVSFSIPANSTQAIFANGSNEIRLQSGTVAGTIKITPAFATQTNLDLTPASPEPLQLTVPRAVPTIVAFQVAETTTDGFAVAVTGFSTTRSLSSIEFQFQGASGVRLSGERITLEIAPDAAAWFSSTASRAFGGQFVLAVPFTLRTDTTQSASSPALFDQIQSVSVTVANEIGASNTATRQIH